MRSSTVLSLPLQQEFPALLKNENKALHMAVDQTSLKFMEESNTLAYSSKKKFHVIYALV